MSLFGFSVLSSSSFFIDSLLSIFSIMGFGSCFGSGFFSAGVSSPVSNLCTNSDISFATSAFTEIESMPCLTRNFTISGFEPACPQIDVSTPCALHSRITRDICFRTAQFISS